MLIAPNFFTLILENTPIEWGSPDCCSHSESGIIITVSNELQPKQTHKALPIFEVTNYVDALLATLHGN